MVKMGRVGEDLVIQVAKTFNIARFMDEKYPDIFDDSVGKHTLRCLEEAERIISDKIDGDLLKRIIAIHDLPELIAGDVTVVRKRDDREEIRAARKILTKADFELWEEFEKAGLILGGSGVPVVLPEAVLARILDTSDGCKWFHARLAIWSASDKFDRTKFPPLSALTYTFETNKKYKENLKMIRLEPEIKGIAEGLLREMLEFTVQRWKIPPAYRIPEKLVERLAYAEEELAGAG